MCVFVHLGLYTTNSVNAHFRGHPPSPLKKRKLKNSITPSQKILSPSLSNLRSPTWEIDQKSTIFPISPIFPSTITISHLHLGGVTFSPSPISHLGDCPNMYHLPSPPPPLLMDHLKILKVPPEGQKGLNLKWDID